MKVGDLVKARGRPFHCWNGIITGWLWGLPEVLVLTNTNRHGRTGMTVAFHYATMEILNESR